MDRKLHIGGKESKEGWEIFNIVEASGVDFVGNAKDLSLFDDKTFSVVYASHVLEHFDYTGEIVEVLKEWRRVLVDGGSLCISVPDIDKLSALMLDRENLTPSDRFFVMRMIFGGHTDQYDYHTVGLNREFLAFFLKEAGFSVIKGVESFGFFNDTSNAVFKGIPISLNVIAEKY